MPIFNKRNGRFLFLCLTLSLMGACTHKTKPQLNPNHHPASPRRVNPTQPRTFEHIRQQITSGALRSPEEYLELTRPQSSIHTRLSPEESTQLISLTRDHFFALNPNLAQTSQLIQRIANHSTSQLALMRDIQLRAINRNLCQSGNDYTQLMNSHLPRGEVPQPHLINHHYEVIQETFYPFISNAFLQADDLAQIQDFLQNLPAPYRDNPNLAETADLDRVFMSESLAIRIASGPQILRNRVIEHLTQAVEQLLQNRRSDGYENPAFKYYLIHPPLNENAAEEETPCSYCDVDFDQDHPGLSCPEENCMQALHHGIEFLDHITHSLDAHAGDAPVTCTGIYAEPESPHHPAMHHEVYISPQSWNRMQQALQIEIRNLEDQLRALRIDPDRAEENLNQELQRVNLEIHLRDEAKTNLLQLAQSFGGFRVNIMQLMIDSPDGIDHTVHLPGNIRFPALRNTYANTLQRAGNLRLANETRGLSFPPFQEHLPPLVSATSRLHYNEQNIRDLQGILENLRLQLSGQPGIDAVTIEEPLLTAHRYYRIAQEAFRLKTQSEVWKRQKEPLDIRQKLIKRREQLRTWDDIIHRWKLQTLISYYRHLRGTERTIADPTLRPYRFCENPACSDLITQEQVQNGNYTCESCRRTCCYACGQRHLNMSCEQYQRNRDSDAEMERILHDPNSDIRPCPYCLTPTHRYAACYHMDCTQCHSRWNWQHGRLRAQSFETTWGPSNGPQPPRGYRVTGDQGFIEGQDMETTYPSTDGPIVRRNTRNREILLDYNPARNRGYIRPDIR